MVARLEGDVSCAATGAVASGFEGDDFGVVEEIVLVPAFTGQLARAVKDDAADGGVRRCEADATASQLECSLHPYTVLVRWIHMHHKREL